jgi:hypothetical protein
MPLGSGFAVPQGLMPGLSGLDLAALGPQSGAEMVLDAARIKVRRRSAIVALCEP